MVEQPKVEEKVVSKIVVQLKKEPESQPEVPKSNGEVPPKPQRTNKITRSQSERSPSHQGTGKDRDLRHSFRYSNRNGYKVYVAGDYEDKGVRRWRPKGFGAKKNLFEGKEPVKFLGSHRITSPVAKERHARILLNKPRPKLTSTVSLPCNLNEIGKCSRQFNGLNDRQLASTSNIPAGKM